MIAGAREDIDGDAADPAGRAGNDHRAVGGLEPLVLHALHRQSGRVAGGAQRHGLEQGHALGSGTTQPAGTRTYSA